MAEPRKPYFNFTDLRGGVNDSDSPFSLPANQVVEAKNVDFREGMIATKRKGMSAFTLTGSVFERDRPLLGTSTVGGFTGAASGNISIPSIADVDGTGAANHILIIRITTKAATDVTVVTYGGSGCTNLGQVSNANAGRLEVFYFKNPSIAGATLAITLAGAADCSVIAERWINVDTSGNPVNFASTTATASTEQSSSNSWNAQYMAQYALAWSSTTTATASQPGAVQSTQQSNGNARVLGLSIVGMKPTSQFNVVLGAAVDLVAFVWAIRGRTVSMTTTPNLIYTIMRHTPTNLMTGDELWAQDKYGRLDRYAGAWQTGVPMVNFQLGSFLTDGFHSTNGVSLHGKFFLALDGGPWADRLHVWDGTVLRWAGFATPSQLSVTDTGGGTYPAVLRYYRFRYIEKSGTTILRRSEPCTPFSFTPSGAGTGVLLTKPSAGGFITGEGETHWEIEVSTDGTLFYVLTTLAVGTATYTDSALTSTYSANPLSEDLGEYTPPIAPKHVVVDEDRLLIGGSHFTTVLDSRISWTVLRADDGVGNDERVPVGTRHFLDLDGLTGGGLTHFLSGIIGSCYVFKYQRVYKIIRTGQPSRAYASHVESEGRGCLLRAASGGTDLDGVPCIYFTDPNVGLCQIGAKGIMDLMQMRRTIAKRINKGADVPARVLFYPKEYLIWVWLTLDAGSRPALICCYNIRTNSWTDYTGNMATAIGNTLYPNASSELRPYLALSTLGTSFVCETDTGVNDDGVRFRGYIRTKPLQFGDLYRKHGIQGGTLHAKAGAAVTAGVGLIRDYGVERREAVFDLTPSGTESNVIVFSSVNDCTISECFFTQFELGDPLSFAGAQLDQTWTLDEFCAQLRLEENA